MASNVFESSYAISFFFFFFKNSHAVLQTFIIALEVAEKNGFSDKARTLEIDDEKLLKISPEKIQGLIWMKVSLILLNKLWTNFNLDIFSIAKLF